MKYRTGFVSNSSSSSFVLTAEKETFDKIYTHIHKYIKEILGIPIENVIGETKLIVFANNEDDADLPYKLEKYQGEILDTNGNVLGEIGKCTDIFKFDYISMMKKIDAAKLICDKCNKSKKQTAFFFETEGETS